MRMNNSSDPLPPVLAKPTSAMAALSLNALLLPGVGTVVRGQRAGYFQIAIAVVGLGVSGMASATLLRSLQGIEAIPEDPDAAWAMIRLLRPDLIRFGVGLLLVLVAWIWGIVSCVGFFREDRRSTKR